VRERIGAAPVAILSRTVRTTGIGESALAERLGELGKNVSGMPLAFLPGWAGVDLRVTSRTLGTDAAVRALDDAERELRSVAGQVVYGTESDDMAELVIDMCRERGHSVAVAESCTGGLLGARLTAIPGSSDVFHGGVIAYDNSVKTKLLGVRDVTLSTHGAVSEEVAREMAAGALARSYADVSVAVTGIAGPTGGVPGKPVGTVHFAWGVRGGPIQARRFRFQGDRTAVRLQSVAVALQGLIDLLR